MHNTYLFSHKLLLSGAHTPAHEQKLTYYELERTLAEIITLTEFPSGSLVNNQMNYNRIN
jgi:hypothetical protein